MFEGLTDGLHRYVLSTEPPVLVLQAEEFDFSLPVHSELIIDLQQEGKLPNVGTVFTGYIGVEGREVNAFGTRTTLALADLECLEFTADYPRDNLSQQINTVIDGGIVLVV